MHVAPLDISLLSLPGSSRPRELSSLRERGADEVQAFIASSVLPKEQAAARMSEEDIPRRPYLDPVLHQPRRYEELLRAMESCGMIEWALSCEEQVGLFCVWKKSGKQRLIIDARRSNAHFRTPAKVSLASGDSFGRLQALAGQALHLGQTDIQDAFYQMAMPAPLRVYFGLPAVRAGRLGVTMTVEGSSVGRDTLVAPRLRVLAMGWNRALWWCQRVLEETACRVHGLTPDNRVYDHAAVPEIASVVHSGYVDNFIAFSHTGESSHNAALGVFEELQLAGLRAYPVESGPGGEALGWVFSHDGPFLHAKPARIWRL